MGMLVEARRRKGEFVYRLWSTGGDVYATEPRDGGMMRLTLLRDSVFKALDEFGGGSESGAEKRMERARAHGTSSMVSGSFDVDGPWRRQNEGNTSAPAPEVEKKYRQEEHQRIARHRNLLEELLAALPKE